jgi:hypothetical protein
LDEDRCRSVTPTKEGKDESSAVRVHPEFGDWTRLDRAQRRVGEWARSCWARLRKKRARLGASTSSMTAKVITITRGSIRVVGRGSGPVLVIGGRNGFARFGTTGYPTAPWARREWIGSQSCGSREWITSQSCGRCWALRHLVFNARIQCQLTTILEMRNLEVCVDLTFWAAAARRFDMGAASRR